MPCRSIKIKIAALRRVLLAGLLLTLAACAAPPGPSLPEVQPAPRLVAEGGRWYRLDAAASSLRIHVFRSGRAARLGHNHVLAAPLLAGQLWLPETEAAGARFELAFRLDELLLDPPALRAALGPGWASVLSPEAVVATRANMLGNAGLQAAAFPWVRLRALQSVGELPKMALQLEVELHGQRRSQWVAVQVELDDLGERGGVAGARLSARGALVLRQSDFGLQPFSVAGGLLAVRDELLIEFELVAHRE